MDERDDTPPPRLPPRDPLGHKGTFGRVAVVGGSAGTPGVDARMIGAPALAALAALRAGAGLVRLIMPQPVLDAGLTITPSATGLAFPVDDLGAVIGHAAAAVIDDAVAESDVLAIGPGFGCPSDERRAEGVRAAVVRAVLQTDCPVVLDADALNLLAGVVDLRRDFRAAAVLTPHPGEFARLAESLGLRDMAEAGAHHARRPQACAALARALGCVVVLKGAATVVSDSQRTWVHEGPSSANPALATAGSGDVLTGALAGLIAQARPLAPGAGVISLYDCARLAVRAHVIAAQAWVASRGATGGMLAGDLADLLPAAVESLRA